MKCWKNQIINIKNKLNKISNLYSIMISSKGLDDRIALFLFNFFLSHLLKHNLSGEMVQTIYYCFDL